MAKNMKAIRITKSYVFGMAEPVYIMDYLTMKGIKNYIEFKEGFADKAETELRKGLKRDGIKGDQLIPMLPLEGHIGYTGVL